MGEASYRALLIGVPSYKDGAIKDLPFIEQDLAELAQALDGSGYEVDVHDIEQTSRDEIESAVEIFFQEAAPGETLLLFLSGHGIHHNDTDYLVPRGALTRVHDFPGKCVPIDFGPYAERSAAGDVVVFVDACREGIDLREKGVGNVLRWSDVRVRRVGDRHYCHVYACSKGEFARYATAGQNTFSLFSRALSTLVADVSGPSSLGELEKGLQSALDQLTAEHECQRQQVRVRTESDTDTFTVFPRPQSAPPLAPGESLWARLALQHPAWNQVEESPGARLLKETVVNLVDRLHAQSLADRRLLEDDPWSPPGLAERTTERLTWLLSKVLNAEKLGLSPAEASLLVAVPFLSSAFRDRTAARALHVEPTRLTPAPGASPERVGFEQFVAANSRLARRAAQATRSGRTEGAAGIAWWLFHHWLVRHQSAEDRDDALAELLAPVREAGLAGTQAERKLVADLFDGDQLFLLLRGLLASPDFMVDRPVRRVAGASELEQDIRAQLVFALLTIATRSAIDPLALGDIVVDHLGISYAVSLPRLQETLEKATWDRLGRTRVLRAECEHPAVGLALHQQAAVLDGIFSSIDIRAATEQQLAPLEDLPAHATADEVVPALNAQGQRMYESTDLRFRLADDRIQELLMGEELYGDPALAIRELYQNALDACRYRGARTAYLRATDPGFTGRWEGSISFTQGYDDGRAYIECVDNGIGMGKRELREVFSHAGMRFADLPEYTEELARWETENVEFHPNSRFGIGVLSYFMIADDLQVTTCRLDPEGHPGPLLRVDIAGPGALFHIQEIGRGREAGTAVRLYLRDPATAPSAKDLLRRLLWIADYHVTAEDTMTGPDATPLTWLPEVLSEFAPLGVEDASAPTAARHGAPLVAATRQPTTWWCNGMGAVLADGLWCGLPSFGAVVNLTGRHAPQLTVDRKRCIGWDRDHVQRMLHTEIDALLVADSEVLRPPWLATLAEAQGYRLADAILRAAIAADHRPWGMGDHDAPPAIIGCFPADLEIPAAPATAPDGAVRPGHGRRPAGGASPAVGGRSRGDWGGRKESPWFPDSSPGR
ncbi:caspase family protein [Streptomyces sp. t39]|uniref:HD domain-containing protein n=1 Tax=Streptomyces sp. t39 TaxID=1828156 RepID=UPI0011CEBB3B|nr:caspase family protein [Streptomyces sp. t39]TXS58239.1 hypothetical protein EAO77_00080 [Streptomyces sp. t39]